MNQSERMRSIAAQGWVVMAMIAVASMLIDLFRFTIVGHSGQWTEGFGIEGVHFVLIITAIYMLMPFLITTVSARWFRFFVAGMSMLMTMFVAVHEVSHLIAGNKPFGLLHTLDFAHHIVGIWVSIVAVKWYRAPD